MAVGPYSQTGAHLQMTIAFPQSERRQGPLYVHTNRARTSRRAAGQSNRRDGQVLGLHDQETDGGHLNPGWRAEGEEVQKP